MTLHFAPNPARPLIIDSFAGGGGASTRYRRRWPVRSLLRTAGIWRSPTTTSLRNLFAPLSLKIIEQVGQIIGLLHL